jgi:dTDP-4-amino-4,6-dideoxy-D-galactose acyltransferase
MMTTPALCEYLAWDSAFFGRRIARVIPDRLNREQVPLILAWCQAEQIDCLYFLAAADDAATVRLAEAAAFHFVDTRLTLARDQAAEADDRPAPNQEGIRPATLADIPALRAIARESHHDTRFYYDGNFAPAQCDALYATWIEKSCRGDAAVVFVAEGAGQPVGYLSCHLPEPHRGQIGLLAVSAAAQGRGLGHRLLQTALHWFAQAGTGPVAVVTQGRNIPAQRLYQRYGFRTQAVQLWYHRWFAPVEAPPL